jgi:DNA helicase-2/ATP-dependent DNA helicase PcrA
VAYPKAARIDLTKNYRSSEQVIQHSNVLIQSLKLPDQVGHRGDGADAFVGFFDGQTDQAVNIAQLVTEARNAGYKGGDIAVLMRTNAQSASIERAFVASKLPYWCKNGGFFERMEIGDLVAYLRLAQGNGDEQALRRIINRPTRYLGAAFCDAVMSMVARDDISIKKAIPRVFATRGKNLSKRQREAAKDLANLLDNICPPDGDCLSPYIAVSRILAWTEYIDWLKRNDGSDEGADQSRQENIEAFMSVVSDFGTIEGVLEFIGESNRLQQETNDATEISTVHRAKGREWPIVIVSNFHEFSFPHKRAVEEGHLPDERRVAYVAATRARDVLAFSVPKQDVKGMAVTPSRFLRDMDLPDEEPDSDEDLAKEWWGDLFKEKT